MDRGAEDYRRYLHGDDEGLVALIRAYQDGLLLYLNGYFRNLHAAEECVEEVFVKLAVKRPHFAGRSSFKTWLYAIARRMALDELRRRARHALPLEEAVLSAEEESLETAYLQEERKIALHRALSTLNPDYRQALHLLYFEELTPSEVAAVMGRSARQMQNLTYRAKGQLRQKLEQEGFVYDEL